MKGERRSKELIADIRQALEDFDKSSGQADTAYVNPVDLPNLKADIEDILPLFIENRFTSASLEPLRFLDLFIFTSENVRPNSCVLSKGDLEISAFPMINFPIQL